jgi:hypothetical protein
MITKERLEELIEQEATVWFVSGNEVAPFWLFNHYKYVDYEEANLYENKEDAEFVAKYHTSRVAKFEPPTWEEIEKDFININKFGTYPIIDTNGLYMDIFVDNYANKFIVLTTQPRIPLTKENYYKAVERARKLFLGEEDVKD